MSETKLTSATVRVMISRDYSNFETILTLENPEGILISEINNARIDCQALSMQSVKEYQETKQAESKAIQGTENKRLTDKVEEIKSGKTPSGVVTDPKEIANIESLPLYTPPAKEIAVKEFTKTAKTRKKQ